MIFAWARSIALWTSVCDERRVTTTLSYEPVSTSVLRRPSSSMSTVANTNTTSAIPLAVSKVVSLRVHRLRKVYENGIFTARDAYVRNGIALPGMTQSLGDTHPGRAQARE